MSYVMTDAEQRRNEITWQIAVDEDAERMKQQAIIAEQKRIDAREGYGG